jgi:hypothetical protein
MVKKLDMDFEYKISQFRHYGQSMDDRAKQGLVRSLRLRQSFLLATPQNTVNVAHFERGGDSAKAAKIDSDLKKVIESLPRAAKGSIEQFIHDIRYVLCTLYPY